MTIHANDLVSAHLALGWCVPERIIDLLVEFRNQSNGRHDLQVGGLAGAFLSCGLPTSEAFADPASPQGLQQRVAAVERLYRVMEGSLDVGHALLRGRYMMAAGRIEAAGVPVAEVAEELARLWPTIRKHALKASLIEQQHQPELAQALAIFDPRKLAIGGDQRNRTPLRPFTSRTGRNQPSAAAWIFGAPAWARNLIRPAPGTALALIDWRYQEFGVAAGLSKDPSMLQAYSAGDPYLSFAASAGAAPADARSASHAQARERFKACALGILNGMGAERLARQLGIALSDAAELLRQHKVAYPRFWTWSEAIETHANLYRELRSVFGWHVHVEAGSNPRFLRNFPLQANGAEMLRLACCSITEAGIRICAPLHDALLIEASLRDLDDAVATVQRLMAEASAIVLEGFQLRTTLRIVRAPHRWSEERGSFIWGAIEQALRELSPLTQGCNTAYSPARPRSISL